MNSFHTRLPAHLRQVSAFAKSLGAVRVHFTWSDGRPVLKGFDRQGLPFSLLIDGDPREWERAVAILRDSDRRQVSDCSLQPTEALDAGLRRYTRLTRGKTWRAASSRPVRLGDYLGALPGDTARVVHVNWSKIPNLLSDAECQKQLRIPQYGYGRIAA